MNLGYEQSTEASVLNYDIDFDPMDFCGGKDGGLRKLDGERVFQNLQHPTTNSTQEHLHEAELLEDPES